MSQLIPEINFSIVSKKNDTTIKCELPKGLISRKLYSTSLDRLFFINIKIRIIIYTSYMPTILLIVVIFITAFQNSDIHRCMYPGNLQVIQT